MLDVEDLDRKAGPRGPIESVCSAPDEQGREEEHPKVRRERSRSRRGALAPRRGTIATISGGKLMPQRFAGERVPIKGIIELETTFEDEAGVKTILVLYTVVDAEASYNIIMGRLALNRLGAVVSTYHLCMKFSVGQVVATVLADTGMAKRCYKDSLRVGSTTTRSGVNVLDLDLDPRHFHAEERPYPVEDLKEV
ncbi:hypothetical protein CR513_19966, partial [Mucuna pruriens]